MSEEIPRPPDDTGLRTQREAGLANLPNGGLRPLSEIINRSLVHIQTSKAQWILHRLGGYDLYGPDYRMVCAWAEELRLTEEEVLFSLLNAKKLGFEDSFGTLLSEGHFRSLFVDGRLLPVLTFPSCAGLMIERLSLFQNKIRDLKLSGMHCLKVFECLSVDLNTLDLSEVPNLTNLRCTCHLIELDLNAVPLLAVLDYSWPLPRLSAGALPNLTDFCCVGYDLKRLELSPFPNLQKLQCQGNPLADLDLSPVVNLTELYCWSNDIAELDLDPVPNLKVLWCGDNQMKKINLSKTPNLEDLKYFDNHTSTLDLSCVPNLTNLACVDLEISNLDLTPLAHLLQLNCTKNFLTDLNLSVVPLLEKLDCSENQLAELDIRNLRNLNTLKYDPTTCLIQRPDQNFK